MKRIFLPVLALIVWSCGSTKKVSQAPEKIETVIMDTVYVDNSMAEPDENEDFPYRSTFHRSIDITNTKLDIRFDWENEAVIGKAWIDLTPVFYETNRITLDAVNFDFHEVKVEKYSGTMDFDYDGEKLMIMLDRPIRRGEVITFRLFQHI